MVYFHARCLYPFYCMGNSPLYQPPCTMQIGETFEPVEMNRSNRAMPNLQQYHLQHQHLEDHGGNPFVINIDQAATENSTFRTSIWTGEHLQVTVMSIEVGEDIGLEIHEDVDQFLRIEQGQGLVQMGTDKNNLHFRKYVNEDDAIMIPAGTWHNLTNTGDRALKLYTIYAPPEHPPGTIHRTKAEAIAAEGQFYR